MSPSKPKPIYHIDPREAQQTPKLRIFRAFRRFPVCYNGDSSQGVQHRVIRVFLAFASQQQRAIRNG